MNSYEKLILIRIDQLILTKVDLKMEGEDGGWGSAPPAFLSLIADFSLSEYLNLSEYFGT